VLKPLTSTQETLTLSTESPRSLIKSTAPHLLFKTDQARDLHSGLHVCCHSVRWYSHPLLLCSVDKVVSRASHSLSGALKKKEEVIYNFSVTDFH